MRLALSVLSLILLASLQDIHAQAPSKPFRTDADGPVRPDEKKKGKGGLLEWYQVQPGKFPPAGSAHAITGELIKVDHLERRFQLRVDRNDSQDRALWDLPVDSVMLPYGAIHHLGVPAALQDIPLGTHLHGLFYMRAPDDTTPAPDGPYNRKTPEIDFRRCFSLEDDFTHYARQKQLWKIDAVDLEKMKVTATLHGSDGKAMGGPKIFDLTTSTRVWQGREVGTLQTIQPGQSVLFNLTWVTLYGPGRIQEIWVDEVARELATAHQLTRHHNHIRERGLPGWVDAVDDEAQIVTITFFGSVDEKLFEDLPKINPEPFGWPLNKKEDNPLAPKGTIAVARESLMTWDPLNDRKGGNILDIKKVPLEPGSSGVQIRVKCDLLLEGYRPTRIVRFYPATWKVDALPREEGFEGRE